jgi:ankyrin repeat protein
MWASDGGDLDIAMLLMDAGSDILAQDADGQTALHFAVMCDHVGMVTLLVNAGADISIKDNDGHVPASIATTEATIRALAGIAANLL